MERSVLFKENNQPLRGGEIGQETGGGSLVRKDRKKEKKEATERRGKHAAEK